jgi:hypothetical protein
LGGAKLYNCLGLNNNNPELEEFLQDRAGQLVKPLVPTTLLSLWFLLAEGATTFMADLNKMTRCRVPAGLYQLPAEVLILDF